jgi:hypothetical protein
VEEVVLNALAKQPTDRFASVEQFAEAFEHACTATLSATFRKGQPLPDQQQSIKEKQTTPDRPSQHGDMRIPRITQDISDVTSGRRTEQPPLQPPTGRHQSQAAKFITRPAIVVIWLNMVLATAAFLAVIFAIVMGKIAPDQFEFTNTLGVIAYSLPVLICCSLLYVLFVYRQWPWFVGLLVAEVGAYLSNSIFVPGILIYFVVTGVPLVFSFGWFLTSRRTIAMRP